MTSESQGRRKAQAIDQYFEGEDLVSYWRRFAAMLTIAVIIATVGLYRNSSAVVIAAMLIAPLMTPILGIASSMVIGRTKRVLYLLLAVSIATVANVALAYLMMLVTDAPRGMKIPNEVLARTDPGLEEMMVALAAGIAGSYVQMRKEEASLLPGVAIGVSLVPPLSAAGMLFYFGDAEGAWEAVLLYLTNLVAIVLSASAVFFALGIRPAMRDRGLVAGFGAGTLITCAIVAFLTFELSKVTIERFRESRLEQRVAAVVLDWAGDDPVEIVRVDVLKRGLVRTVEIWLIIDVPLSAARVDVAPVDRIPKSLRDRSLARELTPLLGENADVVFRVQIRYGGLVDLRTRKEIGKPPVEEPEDAPE